MIVGTPLDEEEVLAGPSLEALKHSKVIIGESRNVTLRWLKRSLVPVDDKELLFYDPNPVKVLSDVGRVMEQCGRGGGMVVLLSDAGMPILFDPGREVLELGRRHGFHIRSCPSATSWGTACAMSGFSPPFYIQGFTARETELRRREIGRLAKLKEAVVLIDTPYRFRALLRVCLESFGSLRESFLAWEISKKNETYIWGSLGRLEKECAEKKLEKGEFVLIIKGEP